MRQAAVETTDDVTFLAQLDRAVTACWARVEASSYLTQLTWNGLGHDLAKLTLRELYHFTAHNSCTHFAAVYRTDTGRRDLFRLFTQLAGDALADERSTLEALSETESCFETPLLATQALIAHLEEVRLGETAVRLGHSYWTEAARWCTRSLASARWHGWWVTLADGPYVIPRTARACQIREAIGRHVRHCDHRRSLVETINTTSELVIAVLDEVLIAHVAGGGGA